MEIEVALTKKQLMKIYLYTTIRNPNVFIFISVFMVFLAIGLLTLDEYRIILLAFVFIFLIIAIYSIAAVYLVFSPMSKNLFINNRYKFDENALVIKSDIQDSLIKWNLFVKWEKVPGYFLLYPTGYSFLAIPEESIPLNELDSFEKLLEQKIAPRKLNNWTWKIKGILLSVVFLSALWFFTVFIEYMIGYSILGYNSIPITVLWMVLPILLLLTVFYFIYYGKKTGSKSMVIIFTALLGLLAVLILAIILDIYVFESFMY
jgi:hypothetical protein